MTFARHLATYLTSAVLLAATMGGSSWADEPAEEFLNALRERGYYDLALSYIDRLQRSTRTPSETKDSLPYQRGVVLVEAARGSRDPVVRQRYLDRAEKALSDFISLHADHESAPTARTQLANVMVDRARALVTRGESDPSGSAELLREARSIFDQAHKHLLESQGDIAAALKQMPVATAPRRDPELAARRDELRNTYVQSKLASARVLLEKAGTLEDDENEYQEMLKQSATAFHEVADKYRKWSAGLYARLYEGKCLQLMGETKKALSYYQELLQQKDNAPAIRVLKTKALNQAIDCWLSDTPKGAAQAVQMGTAWLRDARPSEEQSVDWLQLKLQLAKAYQQQAESTSNKTNSSRSLNEARRLAEEVVRRKNPHQKEAQRLLAKLGRGQATPAASSTAAKSFSEARDAAKKALDRLKVSSATTALLESRLAKINDPETRQQVEGKLAETQQQADTDRRSALELFQRAVELADPSTDIDDLNGVRYYLSYLYYVQELYHQAAVLSQFVATRYPGSVAARECANIALASHQRIYQQLEGDEAKASQAERVATISELILQNWSGQPQASSALMTLVRLRVQKGQLDRAVQLLERIPANSPQRGEAELRIGQALWSEYLRGMQRQGDAANAPDKVLLSQLKDRAQTTLAQGIERLRDGEPNETLLRSALSLAQIYVDTGQASEAIKLLNDPDIGAKTLVDEGHQVATIPGFAVETYKTAIRANISSVPEAPNPQGAQEAIDRAIESLDELRAQLGNTPEGQQKLIEIYLGLARDLQRQMSAASPQARVALSQGFETFLNRAGQASDDVSVLNWIGETFYSLGQGFDPGKGNPPDDAKRYYKKAADAFGKVLARIADDAGQVDPTVAMQARYRLAMTLRRLGRFREAVDEFATILGQREKILNIQMDAARTLQEWGAAGKPDSYVKAVNGDRINPATGQNTIWGWGRLASIVGRPEMLVRFPQYRETLHEARYNLALCHFRYALANSQQKQQLLEKARRDILVTYSLYPNLGDEQRKKQYDTLLKTIQKSLGKQTVGLSEAGNGT